MKRHPRVSERMIHAQNIKKLKEWTPANAELYIALLQSLKADGYLEDPESILNFDESGFKLGVSHSKTLAKKGLQYVQFLSQGS
jgi:hypothetical protein